MLVQNETEHKIQVLRIKYQITASYEAVKNGNFFCEPKFDLKPLEYTVLKPRLTEGAVKA